MTRKFIPQRKNANKHTQRGLKELENSIQRDGWIGAVTVAADGETFDGSARIETLANVMPDTEPIVVDVDGNTPVIVRRTDIPNADDPRAKRLAVAANRIAQIDLDWSAEVLAEIAQQEGDLLAGLFNDDELAELIGQGETKEETVDAGELVDKAAELQKKWQVRRGDVWEIGRHRLMCGDSTSESDVADLFGNDKARLIWTDPPYGVKYVGKTKDALTIKNDNLSDEDLEHLINAALTNAAQNSIEGASIYVAAPQGQQLPVIMRAFTGSGFDYRWHLVWLKDSMVLGRGDYHFKHENILYGWKTDGSHYFIGDRTQVSVFEYARPKRNENHPTMKPPPLVAHMLNNSSKAGEIVYDCFNGSGTTLVACEQTGRIGRGMELDPKFAAVTLERLSLLGLTPRRVES